MLLISPTLKSSGINVRQLAGKSDYRLGGSFFDGKGQPMQVSAVSHGCPTTRFNNINVINTKRKV